VTWATSVPILVFLGLSVLDLGPIYATDVRHTDVRQRHRLTPPWQGHNKQMNIPVRLHNLTGRCNIHEVAKVSALVRLHVG